VPASALGASPLRIPIPVGMRMTHLAIGHTERAVYDPCDGAPLHAAEAPACDRFLLAGASSSGRTARSRTRGEERRAGGMDMAACRREAGARQTARPQNGR
jgi:hypothetical protein